jgi:hypothetical protein
MHSKSKITAVLAGCALSTLAACTTVVAATPAVPGAASQGSEYTLHPGEQVTLADHGTLGYLRLANDSRCAPDVQCVWAGDAEVEFRWTPVDAAPQSFDLHTGKPPRQHAIGTRVVTLVSLARGRAPEATVRVDPAGAP